MMKNRLSFICLLALTISSSSCKKFLEVKYADKIMEKDLFQDADGIRSALNGIYMGLSSSALYGKELTMGFLDVVAQYYTSASGEVGKSGIYIYTAIVGYDFSNNNQNASKINNGIWENQYRLLLEINNMIEHLRPTAFNVLPQPEKDLLLGELYALRAFLHFDLLRIYGPIYSLDPAGIAIPYVQSAQQVAQPLLTAKEVVGLIQADLQQARQLLEKDPVRSGGSEKLTIESDDYFALRNYRMNYYAVLLLSARTSLYIGDTAAALQYSENLIKESADKYPFIANRAAAREDPVFSSEALFAIRNNGIYDQYRNLFSPLLRDDDILKPDEMQLKTIYYSENDYRYLTWTASGASADKNYRVFSKYSQEVLTGSAKQALLYFQPLMRTAEAYLIAAECQPNLTLAYQYLNTLRLARGISTVDRTTNLKSELVEHIQAEYAREFWGEGQLFFYFKRNNAKQTLRKRSIDPVYRLPLPTKETDFRNKN